MYNRRALRPLRRGRAAKTSRPAGGEGRWRGTVARDGGRSRDRGEDEAIMIYGVRERGAGGAQVRSRVRGGAAKGGWLVEPWNCSESMTSATPAAYL